MFGNVVIFYGQELLPPGPTYQSEGPPMAGCPRLLIPCIRSCPPYLKAASPFATWGCAMTWWQGPTYHGEIIEPVKITQSETLKASLNTRMRQKNRKNPYCTRERMLMWCRYSDYVTGYKTEKSWFNFLLQQRPEYLWAQFATHPPRR
jgi:hypothetical protein